MNCQQATHLLEPYADQEISEAQATVLKTHLTGCPSCQAEYSALLSVRDALAAYPRIAASPDFDMRVLDAVLAQSTQPRSFLYRLTTSFITPLGELLDAAALGAVLSLITIGIVLLPQLLSLRSTSRPALAKSSVTSSLSMNPYVPRDLNRFYAYNGSPYGISDFKLARELQLFEAGPQQLAKKEAS